MARGNRLPLEGTVGSVHNRYFKTFSIPEDQDDAAWGVLRRYYWNPSVSEDSDLVRLFTGDQVAAEFDTHAELRAFVSGMATVLLSLPPDVVRVMETTIGVEPEWEDRPTWWADSGLP